MYAASHTCSIILQCIHVTPPIKSVYLYITTIRIYNKSTTEAEVQVGESKHAESRARYERDTSHVICLPHIRQNLTALII